MPLFFRNPIFTEIIIKTIICEMNLEAIKKYLLVLILQGLLLAKVFYITYLVDVIGHNASFPVIAILRISIFVVLIAR